MRMEAAAPGPRAGWLSPLAIAVLASCGGDPELRPIVDTPPASSPAYPYDGVDELVLAVAEAGEEDDLRVAEFPASAAPALPSVPMGDGLVVHFSARTGDSTSAYGRTCEFDFDGGDTGELHLYMSRIGRWAEAASPPGEPAGRGFAYVLPDGSAGIAGFDAPLSRFDPRAAAYALLGDPMPRQDASFVALEDGVALAIGGTENGVSTGRIAIYDLRAEPGPDAPLSFAPAPPMSAMSVAPLVDGTAIVAGGLRGGVITAGSFVARPGVDQGIAIEPAGDLNVARAEAVMTRLGDQAAADVLITGGRGPDGALGSAELYRPLARSFEPLTSELEVPRYGHQAVILPDRSVLIVGGRISAEETTASVELFDSSTASFRGVLGVLPDRAGRVGLSVTQLPDGRVLLAGGLDASGEPTDAVYIARLDLESGTLSVLETAPLAVPRTGHQAVVLCDGTVLVIGGADDAPAERYNPPPDGRR